MFFVRPQTDLSAGDETLGHLFHPEEGVAVGVDEIIYTFTTDQPELAVDPSITPEQEKLLREKHMRFLLDEDDEYKLDPVKEGLACFSRGLLGPIKRRIYRSSRVASLAPYKERTYLKGKTLLDLTPEGEIFENQLYQIGMHTKAAGAWRVRPSGGLKRRETSQDEKIAFVIHAGPGKILKLLYPNLLAMPLVGAVRPVMPHELISDGPNAYPPFRDALKVVAERQGKTFEEKAEEFKRRYKPAGTTPNTARNKRQLTKVENWVDYIESADVWAEIEKLSFLKRLRAKRYILQSTIEHVKDGTGACENHTQDLEQELISL